jgi:RNA polymerase sigma-70 factor (ECF subfamily)
MAPTDVELLQLVATDKELALSQLYHRYANVIYSLALYVIKDQSLAEEVVQKTFIHIWYTIQSFDPQRGNLESWIIAIARNLSVTTLRQIREVKHNSDSQSRLESSTGSSELTERNIHYQTVREILSRLSPSHRQLILQSYFSGLTYQEIAEMVNESPNVAVSHVQNAFSQFRSILKDYLGKVQNTSSR